MHSLQPIVVFVHQLDNHKRGNRAISAKLALLGQSHEFQLLYQNPVKSCNVDVSFQVREIQGARIMHHISYRLKVSSINPLSVFWLTIAKSGRNKTVSIKSAVPMSSQDTSLSGDPENSLYNGTL
jgi:hypothetical protein